MNKAEYMRRAIALARLGEGWVHPNPLVGAVIVKDGRVIGEGYHQRYGELHAERNALAALQESAEGATLYVTLEPCCHYGKTPPCTEAILQHGISKVVIGSRDPNPKVAGKGAAILREAGVQVEEDFLREECDALNPVFFHYITKKTPYVILKYAMTMDGKIATKTGASKWITGEDARRRVQEMRHAAMGIMAGIGTVLADDPLLNCRLPSGRNPVRILCDSHLRTPLDSQIARTMRQYETIFAFADISLPEGKLSKADLPGEALPEKAMEKHASGDAAVDLEKAGMLLEAGARLWNLPEQDDASGRAAVDLRKLMAMLGAEGIDSVLLEGGGTLNESALRAGIVQEARVFVAPKIFGGTAASPVMGRGVQVPDEAMQFRLVSAEQIGADLLLTYRPAGCKAAFTKISA